MKSDVETVHVIFKTHLDIGFTDLAQNVVLKYFGEYIPQAMRTAESLRQAGTEERFVWTTGAWLIYEYLEQASAGERRRMEAAIAAGDIVWHGLPFTLHSELLDPSLFRYGLRYARELDRRFGRRTIAAKMTDVPGHTRGIVPLLAGAGIQFLHIGVNEASPLPEVPAAFVWRDEDSGAELLVMYQHSYGAPMVVPGLAEAITFAHTLDNLGPQTPAEVLAAFRETREVFPKARAVASTLDLFARALWPLRSQLPVVTQEIGDTWIHGVGTDPKKMSQFRELCRLRQRRSAGGPDGADERAVEKLSRALLLVAEHTWGMDAKVHLADYTNYGRGQFDRARGLLNFRNIAASWAEQRAYLAETVDSLDPSPFAAEIRQRLQTIAPAHPDKSGFERVADPTRLLETESFVLGFDPRHGAIAYLQEKKSGDEWATAERVLALVGYQTFSQADYDRYLAQYLASRPEWAEPDFSKPGLASAGGESRWWRPRLSAVFCREDDDGFHIILELELPEACNQQYGGPGLITLSIDAPSGEPLLLFDLQWFEKPANRGPEALWFSFCPRLSAPEQWMMEKLGKQISPLDVVRNGNRKLHAVGSGVFYNDGRRHLALESLDAPLVAPGQPSLLNFDNEQPPLEKGMHFNLYNNVWGTNFPLWYDEDARFRFRLRFSS